MTPINDREGWLRKQRAAGRLCNAVREDGQRCNALALAGSRFCRWHDPSPAGEALRQERAAKIAATRSQRDKLVQRRRERRGDDNG